MFGSRYFSARYWRAWFFRPRRVVQGLPGGRLRVSFLEGPSLRTVHLGATMRGGLSLRTVHPRVRVLAMEGRP